MHDMFSSSLTGLSLSRFVLMMMLTCLDVAFLWAQPQANLPQTVSFRRDVEPILQMHCTSCHHAGSQWWPPAGPHDVAGGLSMVSYETLMKGGEHGPVIVPGRPAQSLLIAKVSETDDLRMPLFSPALSAAQINTIRSWIAQGAKKDDINTPHYLLELKAVPRPPNDFLHIACRVLDSAFLGVEVIDPIKQRTVAEQYATVK